MLDRRGTQLLEEIEVPFPKIRLVINVTTDANEGGMEKVKTDLHRFCPISKVARNSGTENRGSLERDPALTGRFVGLAGRCEELGFAIETASDAYLNKSEPAWVRSKLELGAIPSASVPAVHNPIAQK